jgi:hypothetical protein
MSACLIWFSPIELDVTFVVLSKQVNQFLVQPSSLARGDASLVTLIGISCVGKQQR